MLDVVQVRVVVVAGSNDLLGVCGAGGMGRVLALGMRCSMKGRGKNSIPWPGGLLRGGSLYPLPLGRVASEPVFSTGDACRRTGQGRLARPQKRGTSAAAAEHEL